MSAATYLSRRRPASTLQEALAGFHFLPSVCEEAAQWQSEYVGSHGLAFAIKLDDGVTLLRKRKVAKGLGLLSECRAEIDAIAGTMNDSILMLTESNYWIALAYYYYHTGESE